MTDIRSRLHQLEKQRGGKKAPLVVLHHGWETEQEACQRTAREQGVSLDSVAMLWIVTMFDGPQPPGGSAHA